MNSDPIFRDLTESIAKQLVSIEHIGASSLITVPLLYPSGASAVVDVNQHGDRFFVSDMGYGYQEAEMLGAMSAFSKHASILAEHYGVRFDNQAFFVAEATKEKLKVVITIIANCSVEATSIAAQKAAERRYSDDSDLLYERLVNVFPREKVARNVHLSGSSTHEWTVAALVSAGSRKTIFDPVAKHHGSVVNASAKFHDFARLDNPPRRVAMVRKLSEMDSYLNLLTQSADVVEYDATSQAIEKLAA